MKRILLIILFLAVPMISLANVVSPTDVCFECHKKLFENITNNKFIHGAITASECTEVCHDTHASDKEKLLKLTGNRLCYGCHEGGGRPTSEYITDNQLLSKRECTPCHDPHASDVLYLLKYDKDILCRNCHEAEIILGKIDLDYMKRGEVLFHHHYIPVSACQYPVKELINKLQLPTNKIVDCQAEKFIYEGKDIFLVHVEYGDPNDCPSGCFYNHFCALIDGDNIVPFSLAYVEGRKKEIQIPKGINDKNIFIYPPGKYHPLTYTEKFKKFFYRETKQGEKFTNSEFRWCY